MTRVLVTGGAGFIGSHVCDRLLRSGYDVRCLDRLDPQVHLQGQRPEYLAGDVELLHGDVRDPDAVRRALNDVEAVVHLAAAVGVGQSMYEIAHYVSANALGSAVLLEELARRPVARLVVASSMSLYGEGLYRDADGRLHDAAARDPEQVKRGDWELRDADGRPLTPVPTPETKTPALESVYALSKHDQERMALIVGRAYGIPTIALRFFNVYGPRQALSNPYTGVLAIFAARLLNGRRPLVFEDGLQRRDFVSVHDVARAVLAAVEHPARPVGALNIGGGRSFTIREIAERLATAVGRPDIEPEITGQYRAGDIRHCFADIGRARQALGYAPEVALEDGMRELAGWLEGRTAFDRTAEARRELARRGLTS